MRGATRSQAQRRHARRARIWRQVELANSICLRALLHTPSLRGAAQSPVRGSFGRWAGNGRSSSGSLSPPSARDGAPFPRFEQHRYIQPPTIGELPDPVGSDRLDQIGNPNMDLLAELGAGSNESRQNPIQFRVETPNDTDAGLRVCFAGHADRLSLGKTRGT